MNKFKSKYFYGWNIVFIMAITSSMTMALGTLNFGLFIKPMGDELQIGRSFFGWAQTARQLVGGLTSPWMGIWVDKYGSRIILPLATLITGMGLILLGFNSSGILMIIIFGFIGITSLGGPGALITTVPISKWFVSKRGKALAITSLGVPIGAMIFVPLTQYLIDFSGWRNTWIIFGLLAIIIIIPPSLVLLRRQPEDIGLLPDGEQSSEKNYIDSEVSWEFSEAIKTSVFWRITICLTVISMATGTIAIHRIPAFMDRGLDPQLIAWSTAFDAVCAGISTFTVGNLVRRVGIRILGTISFLFLAFASWITIYAFSFFEIFISMAIFGLGIGGLMFIHSFIWADYFGRKNLGQIRGKVTPFILIIGGAGAPVAGYVRDFTGSYEIVWFIGMFMMFFTAALFFTCKKPKKKM
ncbi:MAG: MFS transporter [Chloroflexota bacterium]|mgnify:FL=1|nr:MFS transporter [Chloroflexota bacterium]MED5237856.1 MFS transporter [Chloroflexota bacterium]|tara:strand:- start:1590 stop:2822 length:1233 start_codon:yes stop_codon:yes gene_type:complete